MLLYNNIEDYQKVENPVVTIGTFDGVHIGHLKLIERLREVATETAGKIVLLTFFPHPRMVLYPNEHGVELLNTTREKISLLEQSGIDCLIIHPFDQQFSELSSTEFVRRILVDKIGTRKLVIGYDHHFGKNREGSFEDLLKMSGRMGFQVEKIPEQDVNDIAVSSTFIRNALKSGDIETATSFLGRHYSLTGIVVHGNKIGRTLGFPTANLQIPEDYKLIPAEGVYVVRVSVGNEFYHGLLSIGRRPTLEMNGKRSIEVFILDFSRDIYGSELTLDIYHRIREDKKFNNLHELTEQMRKDVAFALSYLRENPLIAD